MRSLMTAFRIALAQLESQIGTETYDPRPDNLARAEQAIKAAADKEADLVMFGEMYLTGYHSDEWNSHYALTPNATDPYVTQIVSLAAAHDITVLVGSGTHSLDGSNTIRNSALLVSPTGLLASYDKLHVARIATEDHAEINETQWFSPGTEAPVWDTERFGVIGPQVCYDCHFPEISRVQSLAGAEVLLNVAASIGGWEASWEHYRVMRAMENSAWYVICSIVGEQKGERYFGRSSVVNPAGEIVVQAADGIEDLVVADIEPSLSGEFRRRSFLEQTRRPQVYEDTLRTAPLKLAA
jgi:predicted amidohydrolase